MPETSTTIESDRVTFSAEIKAEAMRLGFDLAGIAPAVTPSGFDQLQMWLQRGYAGAMNYLPRREAAYQHPRHVMDGVRSLVILAINYRTVEPAQPAPMQGVVSRYAWSELDYHDFIRGKLKQLSDFVHFHRPGCRTRGAVDTARMLLRTRSRQQRVVGTARAVRSPSKGVGKEATMLSIESRPTLPTQEDRDVRQETASDAQARKATFTPRQAAPEDRAVPATSR